MNKKLEEFLWVFSIVAAVILISFAVYIGTPSISHKKAMEKIKEQEAIIDLINKTEFDLSIIKMQKNLDDLIIELDSY